MTGRAEVRVVEERPEGLGRGEKDRGVWVEERGTVRFGWRREGQ